MSETTPTPDQTADKPVKKSWNVQKSKPSLKMALLRYSSSWFTFREGESAKDLSIATKRVHRILTMKSRLVRYAAENPKFALKSKPHRDNYLWCWPAGYQIRKASQKFPCRLALICPWCWARRVVPLVYQAARAGEEKSLLVSRKYVIPVPYTRFLVKEHALAKVQEVLRLKSSGASGWMVSATAEPSSTGGYRVLVSSLSVFPASEEDRQILIPGKRPALWHHLRGLKTGVKFKTQSSYLPLESTTVYKMVAPYWKFPRMVLKPGNEAAVAEMVRLLKGQHLLSIGGSFDRLRSKD